MYGTVEEQMAARFAGLKAGRVEDLHRRSAARLKNQGCVKAFGQWQETAATRARIMRALKVAGSKLAKPKLVAGMAQWSAVWSEAKREKWMLRIGKGLARNLGPAAQIPHMFANWASMRARLSSKQQLTQMKAKFAQERLEAKELHEELRKAKEHEQLALARLEKELHGSVAEQMAAREAREKEARIEGIAQRAVKRIKNGGILRGWTSWFDMWSEKVRVHPSPPTAHP